jgi:hypothetical protein
MSERMIMTRDLGTNEELTLFQDAGGRLYINDERVWHVGALNTGLVALTTGIRTVHIAAADYWLALHGEGAPSLKTAGVLIARLAHLERDALALIAAIEQAEGISPAAYPAVWDRIAALRTLVTDVAPAEPAPAER